MGRKSRQSLEVARRRRQVVNLYLQGWSQAAIAEHLQIAQWTVSRDLKQVYAEWRESTIRDFDTLQTIEVQKLERLEREAWAAWERSQKPSQQARIKGANSEQNAERVVKNQIGDPRFLEQVHKCIAGRRAILGLDAPTRIEPVTPPVRPLSLEERRRHIDAIIEELKERAKAQEQKDEAQTIDGSFGPADGREIARIEPPGAPDQSGA